MTYWPTGTERQLRSAQAAYDNRAEPEVSAAAGWMLEQIRIAEEMLGRADRAIRAGNLDAAADLIQCAANELTGNA
jgi:hypothetical protein